MALNPLADRIADILRKLTQTGARDLARDEAAPHLTPAEQRAELGHAALPGAHAAHPLPTARQLPANHAADHAPERRRIPAPKASPLVAPKLRALSQEETRLHWHHRDLPVSRFSSCLLLNG